MARIRTIKPEFFTSEDVVALSPLARLLFVALWCECDREGRLLWKPNTFKLRYLPADACDPTALGRELIERGMVVLYGSGLAHIPTFARHQHLNPRESASKLPRPDACFTRADASASVPDAQGGREGKGKEGKGISSLRSESSSAAPADRTSGTVDMQAKATERLAQVTDDAIAAFNALLAKPVGQLASVRPAVGKSTRQDQVKRCLKTAREICQDLYTCTTITRQFWDEYFGECARDPFHSGRQAPGPRHENWKPDFEYLTRKEVMLKVFDRASSEEAA